MSFSEAWLRQREPYDHAARSVQLAQRFAAAVGDGSVLDLGGGSGSGARFLRSVAPGLAVTVVDHDPALLAAAAKGGLPTLQADLFDLDWPDSDGLHCQALLDVMNWSWMEAFIRRLTARPVPILASLTVDGRVAFDPEDPDDEEVMSCFRAHQVMDKGRGSSPGPRAGHVLAERLPEEGWEIIVERSDWRIPASDDAMVRTMVDGIVEAASVMHPDPERVRAWGARRGGGLMVGHIDVLALPVS